MIYISFIVNYYLHTTFLLFEMADDEKSHSKRRRVLSEEDEYNLILLLLAQMLALRLLPDIGIRNMLVPITNAEVISKNRNYWKFCQQEQKKIATINQKYTHFLIKDSNENTVGIIINFPRWKLYKFKIIPLPSQ